MTEFNDINVAPLVIDDIPLIGRHSIEASAGTGKTYNITRLYLRLLLERQLEVQQILVVTFTNAATEELRGRISETLREALQQAIQQQRTEQSKVLHKALLHLDEAAIFTIHGFCKQALQKLGYQLGIGPHHELEVDCSDLLMDSIRDWLRSLTGPQLALLPSRDPEHYFSQYYMALNSDTPLLAIQDEHSLAVQLDTLRQQLLAFLQPYQSCIEQIMVDQVKRDKGKRQQQWQYIAQWLNKDNPTLESIPELHQARSSFFTKKRSLSGDNEQQLMEAQSLLTNKHLDGLFTAIDKLAAQRDNLPWLTLISDGITTIRSNYQRAKDRSGKLDVNDLIILLYQGLNQADAKPYLQQLTALFPVALVDEFQDTDMHQYGIFSALYPALSSQPDSQQGLFMIGDPKQAIYRFRGGDIYTYLTARQQADYHWNMNTNWRSSPAMISAYNHLFEQANSDISKLGEGIHYHQVNWPHGEHRRSHNHDFVDPANNRALQFLIDDIEQKNDSLERLAEHCSTEIRRLLHQARLKDHPLKPADIAVLVPAGRQASIMQQQLARQGLPSVYLSNRESVYNSEEAIAIKQLMDGLLNLQDERKVVAALATRLMGGNLDTLYNWQQPEHDQQWQSQRDKLAELYQLWQQQGFLAMMMNIIQHRFIPESQRHERSLTNVLHLIEILQQAAQQFRYPAQLYNWYCQQISLQIAPQSAELRLESEQNLIQIITLHGSKGLEYPVVFIPFATQGTHPLGSGHKQSFCQRYFAGQQQGNQICLAPDKQIEDQIIQQDQNERTRLLYVGVTRAIYRCYVGVSEHTNHPNHSVLGALLNGQQGMLPAIAQLAEHHDDIALSLLSAQPPQPPEVCQSATEETPLASARLSRPIQDQWRLHSFTGLTRMAHSLRLDKKDRVDLPAPTLIEEHTNVSPLALRFRLAKGAHSGNLLHDILEHLDFSRVDDQTNWQNAMAEPLRQYNDERPSEEELQQWLEECVHAPLPSLHGDEKPFSLSMLSQCIKESEFYFTLSCQRQRSLTTFIQRFRQGSDAELLLPEQLEGMMHGFIDLIFCYQGRYYVADYKSTHLGNQFDRYHHDALLADIQAHSYDLQYLIYALALHRYLGQTLPDYDPEQHLGGVYYLYLRGMHKDGPQGIYSRGISAELLDELEQIFAGQQEKG